MEADTESSSKLGTAQEADRGHGGPGPTDPEREYEGNQEPGSREGTNRKQGITSQEVHRGHGAGGATEVTDKGSATTDPEQDYGTNQEPGTASGTDQEHATTNQEPDTVEVTNQKNATSSQELGSAIVTDREHATINQEPVTNTVTNHGHATINQKHDTATATNQEHFITNLEPDTTTATNQEHATTSQEPSAADVTDQEYATTSTISQEPDFSDYTGTSQKGKESKVNISDENIPLKQQEERPEEVVSSFGTSEHGVTPEEMKNNTEKKDPDTSLYQDMAVKPLEGHEATQDDLGALENEDGDPPQEQEQWQQEPEDEKVREALIEQYQALVSEREKVLQQNSQLQHKLYEYFRRKKGEESRPETEKHVEDQEQRYLKSLATLEEMRKKYREDAASHQQQIEELKVQCEQVVSQVDKEWTAFQEQKKKTALYLVNRGGRHAVSCFSQELNQLQSKEEHKEKEVIQVRLENIKIKNQIHCYESTMRSKEELADGLHLIDFEQLKIENQTYNEKIEERNEELLKLRKKISNTVQVLTHLKEKLQYVQAENQEQKERLMEIEALVAHRRDILTKTKQARDSLRMDNLNLKQKCGLLGNKTLLRDFEDKVDTTEELSQKLEGLKRHHAELTLSSKGIMKKIEEAKSVMED